jgi:hypothetical protein
MWIIDLKQMQQYYGTKSHYGEAVQRKDRQRKEIKNLNEVDVLTVQG